MITKGKKEETVEKDLIQLARACVYLTLTCSRCKKLLFLTCGHSHLLHK